MIPSNYASPGRSEHAVCAVRSFTFFGVGIPGPRAHVDIHTGFYAAPAGSLAVRLADGRPRVELTARSGAAPFAVEPVHRTYGRLRPPPVSDCSACKIARSHGSGNTTNSNRQQRALPARRDPGREVKLCGIGCRQGTATYVETGDERHEQTHARDRSVLYTTACKVCRGQSPCIILQSHDAAR